MDFVIIANAWSARCDNPTSKHQIALELARQGHRVLWLEGAGMRRPTLGSGADRGRILRHLRLSLSGARRAADQEIWVVSPLLVPLPSVGCIRRFNGWLYCTAARRWCRRLEFKNPVLINYVPVLAEAMRFWRKAEGGTIQEGRKDRRGVRSQRQPIVYHCVDRWDKFDMYDSGLMREVDNACSRYADVVVASSSEIYEHCSRRHDSVHLVNHGVNYEHFSAPLRRHPGALSRRSPASRDEGGHSQTPILPYSHTQRRPPELPPGPIIGFFGLVSEWIDQALLLRLAQSFPDAQLVMIGKADVPIDNLQACSNIHILGPRPFRDLPDYVAHFDVGIIPFKVNELTRAVNPIKLREMLAAGCPVVATDLTEVTRCTREGDRTVSIARSHEEFATLVKDLLNNPPSADEKKRLSQSMQEESWAAKTEQIVAIVNPDEDLSQRCGVR
jgi:glycosyltransferase involved in cell wall biosynthesis